MRRVGALPRGSCPSRFPVFESKQVIEDSDRTGLKKVKEITQ
jgi:hypothetical protein